MRTLGVLLIVPLIGASPPVGVVSGDALLLLPCVSGDPTQSYNSAPSGGGVALHLTASPQLVWDISGPSSKAGTPLHVWGQYAPPVSNQEFSFAGGGISSLFATLLCVGAASLDPATRAPTFGSPLAVFPCNATDAAQRFALNGSSVVATAASAPLCATAVHGVPPPACLSPPFSSFAYCNTSLPVSARVADLVSRMTTEEKVLA